MLSVAIITYNRIEQFRESVLSCAHHINGEWELVVVDNHSTDGTKEWMETYDFGENIKVNYSYMEKNLGVAGARNVAYKNAQGDIVYFLDDDALIEGATDCLNKAYTYMEQNKDVVLMGTEIYDHKINGLLVEIPQKGHELKTGTIMRGFMGGSHFVKKNELNIQTLYPEFIFYGGEELYLSYRCYNQGGICCYYKEFVVHHYPSLKSRLSEDEMKVSRYTNAYSFRKVLFPWPYSLFASVFYCINLAKGFGLKFSKYCECNKRVYKGKTEDLKISKATIRKLVGYFGIVKVFK